MLSNYIHNIMDNDITTTVRKETPQYIWYKDIYHWEIHLWVWLPWKYIGGMTLPIGSTDEDIEAILDHHTNLHKKGL